MVLGSNRLIIQQLMHEIWGAALQQAPARRGSQRPGQVLSGGSCWSYEAMMYDMDFTITSEHGSDEFFVDLAWSWVLQL